MSEPKSEADRIHTIAPGVYGWHVKDERIAARSDAYAVAQDGRLVLIDPLPLTDAAVTALMKLGRVTAICLTVASHQRSAWRYRRRFGAKVHAPAGSRGLLEKPDRYYKPGSRLPASLRPVRTPGPVSSHHALLSPAAGGTLFAGDLLIHLRAGNLRLMEARHHENLPASRRSAAGLTRLKFRNICTAHGVPITSGAKRALRGLLLKERAR